MVEHQQIDDIGAKAIIENFKFIPSLELLDLGNILLLSYNL